MKDYFLIKNEDDYITIVNRKNKLRNNYVPKDLVRLDNTYSSKEIYLRKKAKDSFDKMVKDAKDKNLTLIAVSGYRSYNYQKTLFNNYVKEKGYEYANMCCAKAGHSEHQTGLAVDIADSSLDYDNFNLTKEFNWVKNNAYKYGFILRYPKDKIAITGYKYEPWHYRYVGIDLAKHLYENNLVLEEK